MGWPWPRRRCTSIGTVPDVECAISSGIVDGAQPHLADCILGRVAHPLTFGPAPGPPSASPRCGSGGEVCMHRIRACISQRELRREVPLVAAACDCWALPRCDRAPAARRAASRLSRDVTCRRGVRRTWLRDGCPSDPAGSDAHGRVGRADAKQGVAAIDVGSEQSEYGVRRARRRKQEHLSIESCHGRRS